MREANSVIQVSIASAKMNCCCKTDMPVVGTSGPSAVACPPDRISLPHISEQEEHKMEIIVKRYSRRKSESAMK
mgnify:CR=1 FL=1